MRSNLNIFKIRKREFRMNSSFFGGGGGAAGGGQTRCIIGNWKVENDVSKLSSAS